MVVTSDGVGDCDCDDPYKQGGCLTDCEGASGANGSGPTTTASSLSGYLYHRTDALVI